MAVKFGNPNKEVQRVDDDCWEIQNSQLSNSLEVYIEGKANGDKATDGYGETTITVTETYVCKKATGNLVIPVLGSPSGGDGWHIDTVNVEYRQNGAAVMKLTAHKHHNADHDETRTFASALALPARVLGIPSALIGLSSSGVGIKALSFNISCRHFDEFARDGSQFAGQSCDAVVTLAFTLTSGVYTAGTYLVSKGYKRITSAEDNSNTAFRTNAYTYQKHLV